MRIKELLSFEFGGDDSCPAFKNMDGEKLKTFAQANSKSPPSPPIPSAPASSPFKIIEVRENPAYRPDLD